jgi:hypothetical protein
MRTVHAANEVGSPRRSNSGCRHEQRLLTVTAQDTDGGSLAERRLRDSDDRDLLAKRSVKMRTQARTVLTEPDVTVDDYSLDPHRTMNSLDGSQNVRQLPLVELTRFVRFRYQLGSLDKL